MGTISLTLPADGDTIDAADVNTPLTTIKDAINGNINADNLASNAVTAVKITDGVITAAKCSSEIVNTGEIRLYGGAAAPSGWLLCQGQSLAVADYGALYAAIGYAFGGSGANFTLPDLQDKFPVGKSGTKALASTGGSATHTHTGPSHTHTIPNTANANSKSGFVDENTSDNNFVWDTSGQENCAAHNHGGTSGAGGTGNSGATSTLPSYVAINYIIKT